MLAAQEGNDVRRHFNPTASQWNLETSLYVEHPSRSVECYRRVFGFGPIDIDQKEGINGQTRLCAMRAGDRSVLLLFEKGTTPDTNATGAIHVAFGISRSASLFAGRPGEYRL